MSATDTSPSRLQPVALQYFRASYPVLEVPHTEIGAFENQELNGLLNCLSQSEKIGFIGRKPGIDFEQLFEAHEAKCVSSYPN